MSKPKRKPPTEPSEAALDAMIAERMQNLPEWWYASGFRDDHASGKPCDSRGRDLRRKVLVRYRRKK